MIRKMLDISTAHLPARFFDPNYTDAEGVGPWDNVGGMHVFEYGLLLWVPDDPDNPDNDPDSPEEIKVLRRYARSVGCDWIMLDEDADVIDALPVFDAEFGSPWGVAQQVIALLEAQGIRATWEFPGFLQVHVPGGIDLVCGTVNGDWGGHLNTDTATNLTWEPDSLPLSASAEDITAMLVAGYQAQVAS